MIWPPQNTGLFELKMPCCACAVGFSLWSWGYNGLYQLGLGDDTDRAVPTQVGVDTTWSALRAGSACGLALRTTKDLWSWGQSQDGQIGNGLPPTQTIFVPTQAQPDADWAFIASGNTHALAIKTDGTLWAWGNNSSGQLGNGSSGFGVHEDAPIQIGTDADWVFIAGGADFSLAIKTDGTLWAWGGNGAGQLGLGDTTERDVPTQVGTDTDWAKVAGPDTTTIAIKTDGTLWSWGNGSSFQLGTVSTTDRDVPAQVGTDTDWASITSVANNGSLGIVLAIKTDGTLWAWGIGVSGELGLGATIFSDTPVQVGTDTDWAKVASGGNHTLAIKTDGTLWAWGGNSLGQLGLGDTTDRDVPVQVGSDTNWVEIAGNSAFSLALKA